MLADITVQLDNGHGYDTPGKRSPVWPDGTQLKEYEFNRLIVKMIDEGLKKLKIKTHILVPELNDVPLSVRIKRSNSLTARKGGILVSVHGNTGGGTGMEVFTSPGKTKSDLFASVWWDKAEDLMGYKWPIRKDTADGDNDKEANFAIITKTACPAILTESGFMDRESDCRIMMDPYYQRLIAQVHVEAIHDYLIQI